jgi:hypothetical protein
MVWRMHRLTPRSLFFTVLLSCTLPASAQSFSLTNFTLASGGARSVQFAGNSNYYYILYSGTALTNINQPTALTFGSNGLVQLQDVSPQVAAQFYRVLQVPISKPLDVDGDGISDVYELSYPGCLNPLDPSDATADCDGDGRSNLNEFNFGTDPTVPDLLPTIVINEVDYDEIGTDSTEFLELLNKGALPVHLENYAVVFINGANNLEYLRMNLNGTLAAGQYLVICSSNVTGIPSSARIQYFPALDNNIQNGAPDGVALANLPTRTLLDAFSYEGPITAAIITGFPGTYNLVEGTVLPATTQDSGTIDGSLIRSPNGRDSDNAASDWAFSTTPTPGAANVP